MYSTYVHVYMCITTVRLNKKLTFRCTKRIVLRYAVNRCVTVRHHRCFSVATSLLRASVATIVLVTWDSFIQVIYYLLIRCRSFLGWTFRGSAYCQLIRDVNKLKRYEWAVQYKDDEFYNVVFTDECTVQLEAHRRFCCRKKLETPRPKPRYIV